MRVFLDTNVLIAGIISKAGPPATILDLGEAGELEIVVSRQVLVEADHVFGRKFGGLIERYRLFIKNLTPEMVDDPSSEMIREAKKVINQNDAPILAAARDAAVDYLVSGNTKHFFSNEVRSFLSARILSPVEFLTEFESLFSE